MTTDENPREISVSNNIFVRRVSYSLDDKFKSLNVQIEGEPEVTETVNAVPGEVPVPDQPPTDDWVPPVGYIPWFPGIVLPPTPPTPEPDSPDPGACGDDSPANGPYLTSWDKSSLTGDPDVTRGNIARCWMKGTIRAGTATYNTEVDFAIGNTGNSYLGLRIYGIDASGARVATGNLSWWPMLSFPDDIPDWSHLTGMATFSLPSATAIAGFELELEQGYDITPVAIELDDLEYWNRHGSTWYYNDDPSDGASMPTYSIDLTNGHIFCIFGGYCDNTPMVLGDIFSWGFHFHLADPLGTGDVYLRVTWSVTEGSNMVEMKDGKGNFLTSGEQELYADHIDSNGVTWNIQTQPLIGYQISGTAEIWDGASKSTFRSIGLGAVEVINICPA
jgi:hypothetical protein